MPSERGSSSGSGGATKRLDHIGSSRELVLSSPGPDVLEKKQHEEWVTSKKVVNHKTKQVETRVQRQIIMEDGKVIADSGPQVTTKTKEDNKTEESEDTQHKKSGDSLDDPPEPGYMVVPGSNRVVSQKTENRNTTRETKEENMQMHDEDMREISGPEFHRKALRSTSGDGGGLFLQLKTDELDNSKPRGKLTHFSSKSRKVTDKDEVKETSELKGGELTTQTTRTHHHEEMDDDEVPEDDPHLLKALPSAFGTSEHLIHTPKRIEYHRDADQARLEAERKDAVTKRELSVEEEEEIRNSETNRWLENHFGSDDSDPDTGRTGGNVINIQMSSSTPWTRTKEGDRFCGTGRQPGEVIYTTVRTATPTSTSTPLRTYYLGQEGSTYESPASTLRRPVQRSASHRDVTSSSSFRRSDDSTFQRQQRDHLVRRARKVDRSVQVELSDEEDVIIMPRSSRLRRPTSPLEVRFDSLPRSSDGSTGKKQVYFGGGDDYRRSLNQQQHHNGREYYHTIERDYSNSRHNGYQQSSSSNRRKEFIDGLLTTNDESFTSERRGHRGRATSPPPRLIRASPSPPPPPPPLDSPPIYGSVGRKFTVRPLSPVMNPPDFTPLQSPVEIKNMANAFSSASRSRDPWTSNR